MSGPMGLLRRALIAHCSVVIAALLLVIGLVLLAQGLTGVLLRAHTRPGPRRWAASLNSSSPFSLESAVSSTRMDSEFCDRRHEAAEAGKCQHRSPGRQEAGV
jgi:hypothetical protein